MVLTREDIYEMVKSAVDKVLSENRQDELMAWHGSAVNFDNFDLNFIGTGEGSQAYGYGIYVTGVEETGKMYAVIATYANKNVHHTEGFRAESMRKYRRFVNVIRWCYGKVKGSMKDKPELYIPYTLKLLSEKGATPEMIEKLKQADTTDKFADLLNYFKEMATRSFSRFLYTLDIPDDGYIDWNETDKDFIMRLYNEFAKKFDVSHVNLKKVKTFGDLFSQLRGWARVKDESSKTIIPQKQLSLFLSQLGYTGIRVPTGQSHGGDGRGTNYVIFNADDIHIENKERF